MCRYLRIQLEDLDNCKEAMEYISHLPFKDVRGGGSEIGTRALRLLVVGGACGKRS